MFNIFKSKNKWQHKDSNVRIAAINEELNIQNNEDKTILLALLNEDANELVRRAVLLKFNSFDEYYNASLLNDNKAVQEFAKLQVSEILAGQHSTKLSDDKKAEILTTITSHNPIDNALLTDWLEHEVNPSFVLQLVKTLIKSKNTAQFLLQVFSKKQSEVIQEGLLSLDYDEFADEALLTKLNKKAVSDKITLIIENRLSTLIEQKEKPKKVLKQKQLLLSKLLALKDQSDYQCYLSTKTTLENEWQQGFDDLTCLGNDDKQTLVNKFEKISHQLHQLFAPKEEAYQQAKIAENLQKAKGEAKAEFDNELASLEQTISTAVFENETTEDQLQNQDDFLNKLSQLKTRVNDSVLAPSEKSTYQKKIEKLEKRLSQLPEIAKSVSEATSLISKISQLAVPQTLEDLNDRQQTYNEWLSQFKAVNKKADDILPQSIVSAYKEITGIWKQGLQPLQVEQKQLFAKTKKKLIDIKRLLENGKYKVCFGLFKGVKQSIVLLSDQQQQQLQRDFEFVSEKMAEVSDWEHYIATPRKQELLSEIKDLVLNPLDDPNAQAEKVKRYRKTWNSLGHADEEIDQELNEQFNTACEQAFAPCRLFYAEQEKVRAIHLVTRNQILEEAVNLGKTLKQSEAENSSINFKALDGQLNKLQQRWQQAGEVDRQAYQKLYRQFKNILEPIKNSIKGFHEANASLKQALIVKAEQQLVSEDLSQAINTVKGLQQEWRNVGFAGSHQESRLWQKFRGVNDQVFAKRTQAQNDQQAEVTQLTNDFNQSLETIKLTLSDENGNDKNVLNNAKDETQALLNQVIANKPVIKPVVLSLENFIKDLNEKISQLNIEEETNSWRALFTLIEIKAKQGDAFTENDLRADEHFNLLTNFWQKRLIDQCAITEQADVEARALKTLELEILGQVESPKDLSSQRMSVQVNLMQEQMQSSADINLTERLADWLRLGKLASADIDLLSRLQKVFLK